MSRGYDRDRARKGWETVQKQYHHTLYNQARWQQDRLLDQRQATKQKTSHGALPVPFNSDRQPLSVFAAG